MIKAWDSIYNGLIETMPVELRWLTILFGVLSLASILFFVFRGKLHRYRYGVEATTDYDADIFPRRYDFLDGIRGLSILLVVIFHIWQQSWMWPTFYIGNITINLNHFALAGFMGVEALFVLSGFCLFLPYAKACFTGKEYKVRPWTFYKKRLLRIVPSYFISIALLLVFDKSVYIGTGVEFVQNLLGHLLFVENMMTPFGGSYINVVYWSLAVEMQFYILFPLIAGLMRRHPHLTMLVVALIGNGYRAYILLNKAEHMSIYFNMLPGMIDLFVLGMYGSWWALRLRKSLYNMNRGKQAWLKTIMSIGFVVLTLMLCSMMYWLMKFNYFDTGYKVIAGNQLFQTLVRPFWGIVVMLQMICGVFLFRWMERIFSNVILKFIARISLNLYLWHQWISVKLRVNDVFYYDSLQYQANQYDPTWGKKAFWGSIFVSIVVAYLFTLLDEWMVAKIPQVGKSVDNIFSSIKSKISYLKQEETQQ